jgi:hypothetical protein
MIRDGSIEGLEGAKKRAQARKDDPLGMAPDDDCSSKRQGDMRPPQSKTHRHHVPPYDYRKGEHLSMDPVGPVKVPAPRGLDSVMAYGDKSTSHISVQLYKSQIGSRWRQKKGKRFTCGRAYLPRARRRALLGGGAILALHHHRQRGKVDFR